MDKSIRRINDILVNLFNMVLKLEEESIRGTAFSDLSITEIHTLVAVGTGRPRTMSHVANLLGISVSTLTTAVNKLVRKGYVERVRDEDDRRIVKIHLSRKGRDAVMAHEAFHEEMIGDAVSQLDEEERQRFIASLEGIDRFFMARRAGHSRKDGFTLEPLKLGIHELPIPIVQAGMGLGIADSRLAAAVALEGGLGLIGTAGMQSTEELRSEVENALALVRRGKSRKKGLIGVSIMWNEPTGPRFAEEAMKAGAQVIVTSAAIPTDLPRYCAGKKTALIPTISSRRAASAIIRTWTRKYNRLPDAFILQGPLAAGMLGFREVQLEKAVQEREKIISDIKAELERLENCPLIAGGGIIGRKEAEEAYRCGADGFLLGTRFVTTEECGAPMDYKKLYLNCTANDVTIIKSPVKTSVRAMQNEFTRRILRSGADDYDITESVRTGVRGDHENGLVFCSASVGRISRIDSVKDVFREFTE